MHPRLIRLKDISHIADTRKLSFVWLKNNYENSIMVACFRLAIVKSVESLLVFSFTLISWKIGASFLRPDNCVFMSAAIISATFPSNSRVMAWVIQPFTLSFVCLFVPQILVFLAVSWLELLHHVTLIFWLSMNMIWSSTKSWHHEISWLWPSPDAAWKRPIKSYRKAKRSVFYSLCIEVAHRLRLYLLKSMCI